jgi:RND family efflux transporter MFP subunit
MNFNKNEKKGSATVKIIIRVTLCLVILAGGIMGMKKISSMKQPPVETEIKEKSIKVETMIAAPENIPVKITGHGEAKALNQVAISPEISGRVINIHPRLEQGEIINKGELLFAIEAIEYNAARKQAEAAVEQLLTNISIMEKQEEVATERLATMKRNLKLVRAEYERTRALFEKSNIGTQSGVDNKEHTFNSTTDQVAQLKETVTLFPARIREVKNNLASARASLEIAESRLKHCQVYAPFTGRLKQIALEKEQYVSPGRSVLTMTDDSIIEIKVPIDSRDGKKWLKFRENNSGSTGWFNKLSPGNCVIRWTEEPDIKWTGEIDRIVNFEPKTRTLTVAVRVSANDNKQPDSRHLPLVEGMFCLVEIPGKTLHQVYSIPRWAISFNNTIYLAVNNRLKTVNIGIERINGEQAYINKGIKAGDQIITTRLVEPLENSLLNIVTLKDGQED